MGDIVRILVLLFAATVPTTGVAQYYGLSEPFFCETDDQPIRLRFFYDLDVFDAVSAVVGLDQDDRGVAYTPVSSRSFPVLHEGECAVFDPRTNKIWVPDRNSITSGPVLSGRGPESLKQRFAFYQENWHGTTGLRSERNGLSFPQLTYALVAYRWRGLLAWGIATLMFPFIALGLVSHLWHWAWTAYAMDVGERILFVFLAGIGSFLLLMIGFVVWFVWNSLVPAAGAPVIVGSCIVALLCRFRPKRVA